MLSQKDIIYTELLKGRELTKRIIMNELNIINAGGRILDLRRDGFNITTEMRLSKSTGKNYAVYFLQPGKML